MAAPESVDPVSLSLASLEAADEITPTPTSPPITSKPRKTPKPKVKASERPKAIPKVKASERPKAIPKVKAPRQVLIKTKVTGVTFPNNDGTDRQQLIRQHCRDGRPLVLVREPSNKYDRNAIGVWIRPKRFFGSEGTPVQIGYVFGDLAEDLARDMDSGVTVKATILDVTGGGWIWKRTYGVNFSIEFTV